nr:uncharacterized protein LOC116776701 [Danaus plexippus plexippus]
MKNTDTNCLLERTKLREDSRLAQAGAEMLRPKLQILSLSKVHRNGFGELRTSEGLTFLYSGKEDEEGVRKNGVRFLLSDAAKKHLLDWKSNPERIITTRFNSKARKIPVVHGYVPKNLASEHKDDFYSALNLTLKNIRKQDIVVVMGDLNAKPPTYPQKASISMSLPTEMEVMKAIQSLKNGKTPRHDLFTAEMLKADIPTEAIALTPLLRNISSARSYRITGLKGFSSPCLRREISVNAPIEEALPCSRSIYGAVQDYPRQKVTKSNHRGIEWGLFSTLEDLNYADELCLLSHTHADMQAKLVDLRREAIQMGLEINTRNTHETRCGATTNKISFPLLIGTEAVEKVFVNWCILGIYWPESFLGFSNVNLWEFCDEIQIDLQIKHHKWKWIGHTLRRGPEHIPRESSDGTLQEK